MPTDPDFINELTSLFSGMLGGAAFTFTYLKFFMNRASKNLSPQDIINILMKIKNALAVNSPAGKEITAEEAEDIGRALWRALKDY